MTDYKHLPVRDGHEDEMPMFLALVVVCFGVLAAWGMIHVFFAVCVAAGVA